MQLTRIACAHAALLGCVCLAACGDEPNTHVPPGPGTGGSGGAAGAGGPGGTAGQGGLPTCTTPAELLRCDGRTLNIAPRGGQRARPEHTLLAYDHAFEVGADGLELDVQATSDGVLVMMFDETIDRTTDGSGLLRGMSFDELRGYDAGWRFTPD